MLLTARPRPQRCTKEKFPTLYAAQQALRNMGSQRLECRAYPCGKHTPPGVALDQQRKKVRHHMTAARTEFSVDHIFRTVAALVDQGRAVDAANLLRLALERDSRLGLEVVTVIRRELRRFEEKP